MLGTLLMVGGLLVAQGESAPAGEMATEVRRLTNQLDARRLDQRNAAETALVGLGPDVLSLLPDPDTPMSAEAKQRLARIRRKLEQRLATAAVEASRVTLKSDRMKLSEVLQQIERQTSNRVVDDRHRFSQEPSDPELTVDFDKTPFWTAIESVLKQAGMTVYPFATDRAIHLVERRDNAIPFGENGYQNGPFVFLPVELTAERDLRTRDDGTLRLGILVVWEPRLVPIGLTQKLKEIQAVDERETPLWVDNPEGELEVPVGLGAISVKLSIPFTLPSRDVQEITRLSGTLDALLPGRVETFRFDRLTEAKEVKRRVANATVTLQRVWKNNEVWEVDIRVRFDHAGDALASHRGWIFANEAYLEGPNGRRVENEGYETKMQSENEIGLAYFFYLKGSPKQYTFVYKTPARIFTTQFKYELRDLELP